MRIDHGQSAPSFTATTFQGEPIAMDDFAGKKLWLAFYRWASCPLCNLRYTEVVYRMDEFEEAGIQLVGVFQSPPEKIDQYVGRDTPPFPLIADPEMELYEAYGVTTSAAGLFFPRVLARALQAMTKGLLSTDTGDGPVARVPADFLIAPDGTVQQAYYGQAVSDHIPFDDVLSFAKG